MIRLLLLAALLGQGEGGAFGDASVAGTTSIPDGGNGYVIRASPGTETFNAHWRNGGATFNTVYDNVTNWGWNNEGVDDSTALRWYTQMEARYRSSDANSTVSEWFVQWINSAANGSGSRRPLQMNCYHQGTSKDLCEFWVKGDFHFYNSDASKSWAYIDTTNSRWIFDESTPSANSYRISSGTVIDSSGDGFARIIDSGSTYGSLRLGPANNATGVGLKSVSGELWVRTGTDNTVGNINLGLAWVYTNPGIVMGGGNIRFSTSGFAARTDLDGDTALATLKILDGGDGTGVLLNAATDDALILKNAANTGPGKFMASELTGTFAADDTTPDVSAGNFWTTPANTGATAITDLDNPAVGQIYWICGGSNTNSSTIADSGNFNLSGAMTLSLSDCIELYVVADNNYIELTRVNN
jgi:hypothetical protein